MRAFYALTGNGVVLPLPILSNLMAKTPRQPIELIVRRGALRRFRALTEKTADLPVNVLWDRRTQDRRSDAGATATNRRRKDRRQKPPFTWEVSDFVVRANDQLKKRKRR